MFHRLCKPSSIPLSFSLVTAFPMCKFLTKGNQLIVNLLSDVLLLYNSKKYTWVHRPQKLMFILINARNKNLI